MKILVLFFGRPAWIEIVDPMRQKRIADALDLSDWPTESDVVGYVFLGKPDWNLYR